MGFCREPFGAVSVETRRESFILKVEGGFGVQEAWGASVEAEPSSARDIILALLDAYPDLRAAALDDLEEADDG